MQKLSIALYSKHALDFNLTDLYYWAIWNYGKVQNKIFFSLGVVFKGGSYAIYY